jgi:hypothetical protein
MTQMTPELYGGLLAALRRFYEVIVLDLATGYRAHRELRGRPRRPGRPRARGHDGGVDHAEPSLIGTRVERPSPDKEHSPESSMVLRRTCAPTRG